MFGEARFIVDVWGDQVELVLLGQQSQQDDHRPAAALPHTVVNHLAGEREHLWTCTHARTHTQKNIDIQI